MKKIFVAALSCIALLGAVSCSKSTGDFTEGDKAFGDSIAASLGHLAGANELSTINRVMATMPEAEREKFSKKEFIKGLEQVLKTDTANMSYLRGLYTGFQIYEPMINMAEQSGCPVDAEKVIAAFKEVFESDSISQEQIMRFQTEYMTLNQRSTTRTVLKQKAEGEAYLDKMVAEEGFKTTASGLAYKINNPGEATKVAPTDQIKIHYDGKHIDGTTFDKTGDEAYESSANGFIDGFVEGLQLVGKGGSVTLIIPADLAYGSRGALPKIKPGETLVFDVTVEDVTPAATEVPAE